MSDHYLAWWNLENLFSVERDPDRPERIEKRIKKELVGWTATVLDKKLRQLGKIIKQLNDGEGPDILGVCEVENEKVLKKLVDKLSGLGRNYGCVHADTKDARGIDVAFIYDKSKYKTLKAEVFNHFVVRRNATRDILQVNFFVKPEEKKLVVIGNHWPSRSAGTYDSEPYRIIAAETMSYFHQRILEVHGKDQPIVAMGDFNDEPFDRSLVQYALSSREERKVKSMRTRNPLFFNLMWDHLAEGDGTHFYNGPGMLDQMMVNRPLLRNDTAFRVKQESMTIHKFPEMVKSNGSPRRFGRPSQKLTDDGFSDHFPLSVVVEEK